jgi:hypothetical protein
MFTIWSAVSVISDLDAANYILLCLVHIQRLDTEFSSIDTDDYRALHTYFFNVCGALFGDVPQELIDNFCDDIFFLSGSNRDDAQRIMRDASRDVHTLLEKSKGEDGWETAVKVVKRLEAALMDLGELLEEKEDGMTDEFVRLRTAKLKDISVAGVRDPAGKGDDSYNVVG